MLSKFTPRLYYTEFYETQKITSNIVLYESRDGSAITDSPLALFLNLVIRPEFEELEHIWVVKKKRTRSCCSIFQFLFDIGSSL